MFDVGQTLLHLRDLRRSEYVYCHSEVEYLGAGLVFRLLRITRPILVGQTIWLFAEWPKHPRWLQRLMRFALGRVDLFVANAKPNAEAGRALVPRGQHRYVPFGVSTVFAAGPEVETLDQVPRLLSVGNDRARDWRTLEAAHRILGGPSLRIASNKNVMSGDAAVETRPTTTVTELVALYRAAEVTVVSVSPNLHASGITTLLELAAAGGAAVATRAGGLDEYFTDDEVVFVSPSDPEALATAISALLDDPVERRERSERLAAAFHDRQYTTAAYWRRVTEALEQLPSRFRDA
ncbi:glycosyltransferase family protein [Plantibacter sp. RU18]|uniref:glycosyltransferase family protein n=1 Tax=Plantibacter sp. RU18 TaxID=3158143 RepID=UPI003D36A37C